MLHYDIQGKKAVIKALEAAGKVARAYGQPDSYNVEAEINRYKKELAELEAFNAVLGPYLALEAKIHRMQGIQAGMAEEPAIAAALEKLKEFNNRA